MNNYTSRDGLKLAYKDEGVGLPLICLAGLTRNSSDFDFLAPHVGDVRLIRPDYRGRGASQFADFSTYTAAHEARDVLALMDHLGLEKAAFLGTSRGGLISMGLAGMARDRLLGVCFNDIGPDIEATGLNNIMDYLGRNPNAKTYEDVAKARESVMVGFTGVSRERWIEDSRHLFDETDDGLVINYDPRLRDAFEATAMDPLPNLWPLFDALKGLPLALIHGANSDLLSDKTANEMRRRRPDMGYAHVAGRGHVPFLDEPESLEVIRAWLGKMQ